MSQCYCIWILLCRYMFFLIAAPIVAVIAVLHYVTCASSLCLLVLETIHRVLQCINANCDWSVTSVEALSHREVTLALPPSLSMYACQSAVPDQLTAVPTAATRGSQPPTQVGYTDFLNSLPCHDIPILCTSSYHCMSSTGTVALCVHRLLLILLWWKQQDSVSSLQ